MLNDRYHDANDESAEDILNDSLAFLGVNTVLGDDDIRYGPLTLTVAPKEGKANTLLADHLFSPALFLAVRIERGLIPVHRRKVIELGAGCALPSLLMSTLWEPPSLVVVTDYPDDGILGNLKKNVERNHKLVASGCIVRSRGYEWGADVDPLMNLSTSDSADHPGYDVVILSDLLHFHSSHNALVASITSLLSRSGSSRIYIAAGSYTHAPVCEHFLNMGEQAGLSFQEVLPSADEREWLGSLEVGGLDKRALGIRKIACRYWVGHWLGSILAPPAGG